MGQGLIERDAEKRRNWKGRRNLEVCEDGRRKLRHIYIYIYKKLALEGKKGKYFLITRRKVDDSVTKASVLKPDRNFTVKTIPLIDLVLVHSNITKKRMK